jgi:hypothetical protein
MLLTAYIVLQNYKIQNYKINFVIAKPVVTLVKMGEAFAILLRRGLQLLARFFANLNNYFLDFLSETASFTRFRIYVSDLMASSLAGII